MAEFEKTKLSKVQTFIFEETLKDPFENVYYTLEDNVEDLEKWKREYDERKHEVRQIEIFLH